MSLVRVPRLTTSPALIPALQFSKVKTPATTTPCESAVPRLQPHTDHNTSQEFYNVYGNSVSYTPALNSGTPVIVYVEDANGHEAWSDVVHIPPVLCHFS